MTYYFVGLGNPGQEYQTTRHNAGRRLLERWRQNQGWPEWQRDNTLNALVSRGKLGAHAVQLILPETLMNRSGTAVKSVVKSAAAAARLIVIHDELALPLGRFKLSFDRSAGGHKGVDSVIKALKTKKFIRLRLGVGKSKDVVKYILAPFPPAEEKIFKKVLSRAGEALEQIVTAGLPAAMSVYNREQRSPFQ